jgi:hypothetical protein
MVDLAEGRDDVDVLVVVDDFSGTGDSLIEWWQNVETLVRPLAATVVFASLLMTTEAVSRADELGIAFPVVELGPEDNILLDSNDTFNSEEKKKILAYCRETGCSAPYIRGYGECALLLAFRHGCPNNSLPILWYGDKEWNELFLRRAI